MKKYNIEIAMLSAVHLGSANADIIVDAEAVHDMHGMPYFPAKRFKGLLYESALEMAEISNGAWFTQDDIDVLFGKKDTREAGFTMANFTLGEYEQKCKDWEYLKAKYGAVFSREAVWDNYTSLRYSTSINRQDEEIGKDIKIIRAAGTAKTNSLHNIRVLNRGLKLYGTIELRDDSDVNERIISYAVANLRHVGGKRNRGLGEIKCSVIDVKEA